MSDTLSAGNFTAWLNQTLVGLDSPMDADVACGSCVGCCSSSQFVHVGNDELDALAHIPSSLLFDAPGGAGKVMGYDEHGRCPMLTTSGCSIYEHRPQTCRTYDCRVFEAAGITADQPLIRERSERWRFEIMNEADQALLDQVRSRAAGLPEMPALKRALLALRAD